MYLHVTEFDERPLRGTHSLRSSARFWPVAILNDSLPQRETAAQFHEFNSASFGRARQRGKTTRSRRMRASALWYDNEAFLTREPLAFGRRRYCRESRVVGP